MRLIAFKRTDFFQNECDRSRKLEESIQIHTQSQNSSYQALSSRTLNATKSFVSIQLSRPLQTVSLPDDFFSNIIFPHSHLNYILLEDKNLLASNEYNFNLFTFDTFLSDEIILDQLPELSIGIDDALDFFFLEYGFPEFKEFDPLIPITDFPSAHFIDSDLMVNDANMIDKTISTNSSVIDEFIDGCESMAGKYKLKSCHSGPNKESQNLDRHQYSQDAFDFEIIDDAPPSDPTDMIIDEGINRDSLIFLTPQKTLTNKYNSQSGIQCKPFTLCSYRFDKIELIRLPPFAHSDAVLSNCERDIMFEDVLQAEIISERLMNNSAEMLFETKPIKYDIHYGIDNCCQHHEDKIRLLSYQELNIFTNMGNCSSSNSPFTSYFESVSLNPIDTSLFSLHSVAACTEEFANRDVNTNWPEIISFDSCLNTLNEQNIISQLLFLNESLLKIDIEFDFIFESGLKETATENLFLWPPSLMQTSCIRPLCMWATYGRELLEDLRSAGLTRSYLRDCERHLISCMFMQGDAYSVEELPVPNLPSLSASFRLPLPPGDNLRTRPRLLSLSSLVDAISSMCELFGDSEGKLRGGGCVWSKQEWKIRKIARDGANINEGIAKVTAINSLNLFVSRLYDTLDMFDRRPRKLNKAKPNCEIDILLDAPVSPVRLRLAAASRFSLSPQRKQLENRQFTGGTGICNSSNIAEGLNDLITLSNGGVAVHQHQLNSQREPLWWETYLPAEGLRLVEFPSDLWATETETWRRDCVHTIKECWRYTSILVKGLAVDAHTVNSVPSQGGFKTLLSRAESLIRMQTDEIENLEGEKQSSREFINERAHLLNVYKYLCVASLLKLCISEMISSGATHAFICLLSHFVMNSKIPSMFASITLIEADSPWALFLRLAALCRISINLPDPKEISAWTPRLLADALSSPSPPPDEIIAAVSIDFPALLRLKDFLLEFASSSSVKGSVMALFSSDWLLNLAARLLHDSAKSIKFSTLPSNTPSAIVSKALSSNRFILIHELALFNEHFRDILRSRVSSCGNVEGVYSMDSISTDKTLFAFSLAAHAGSNMSASFPASLRTIIAVQALPLSPHVPQFRDTISHVLTQKPDPAIASNTFPNSSKIPTRPSVDLSSLQTAKSVVSLSSVQKQPVIEEPSSQQGSHLPMIGSSERPVVVSSHFLSRCASAAECISRTFAVIPRQTTTDGGPKRCVDLLFDAETAVVFAVSCGASALTLQLFTNSLSDRLRYAMHCGCRLVFLVFPESFAIRRTTIEAQLRTIAGSDFYLSDVRIHFTPHEHPSALADCLESLYNQRLAMMDLEGTREHWMAARAFLVHGTRPPWGSEFKVVSRNELSSLKFEGGACGDAFESYEGGEKYLSTLPGSNSITAQLLLHVLKEEEMSVADFLMSSASKVRRIMPWMSGVHMELLLRYLSEHIHPKDISIHYQPINSSAFNFNSENISSSSNREKEHVSPPIQRQTCGDKDFGLIIDKFSNNTQSHTSYNLSKEQENNQNWSFSSLPPLQNFETSSYGKPQMSPRTAANRHSHLEHYHLSKGNTSSSSIDSGTHPATHHHHSNENCHYDDEACPRSSRPRTLAERFQVSPKSIDQRSKKMSRLHPSTVSPSSHSHSISFLSRGAYFSNFSPSPKPIQYPNKTTFPSNNPEEMSSLASSHNYNGRSNKYHSVSHAVFSSIPDSASNPTHSPREFAGSSNKAPSNGVVSKFSGRRLSFASTTTSASSLQTTWQSFAASRERNLSLDGNQRVAKTKTGSMPTLSTVGLIKGDSTDGQMKIAFIPIKR